MGDIFKKNVFEADLFKFEFHQFLNFQECFNVEVINATKLIQKNFRMNFLRKEFLRKK